LPHRPDWPHQRDHPEKGQVVRLLHWQRVRETGAPRDRRRNCPCKKNVPAFWNRITPADFPPPRTVSTTRAVSTTPSPAKSVSSYRKVAQNRVRRWLCDGFAVSDAKIVRIVPIKAPALRPARPLGGPRPPAPSLTGFFEKCGATLELKTAGKYFLSLDSPRPGSWPGPRSRTVRSFSPRRKAEWSAALDIREYSRETGFKVHGQPHKSVAVDFHRRNTPKRAPYRPRSRSMSDSIPGRNGFAGEWICWPC